MNKSQPIVFFANTDWYLFNFRRDLIQEVQSRMGAEVFAMSPPGEYLARLEKSGISVKGLQFSQKGLNPLSELKLLCHVFLFFLFKRPQLVHLFTIKCVLYGGIAARLLGIPRVSSITGVGHLFVSESRKALVLRWLITPFFRFSLGGRNSHVIFQNNEDQATYTALGLVSKLQSSVVRGSGINLEYFQSQPLPKNARPVFLFIGRLIAEKGVFELLKAIEILKSKNLDFECRFAGSVYLANPSSLSQSQVDAAHNPPYANFIGHVADIREEIAVANVVVLPSYREGTPKSLLEAAACSRAILCSEIAGNEGVVLPGVNGYTFPVKDAYSLAAAMEKLIVNPEESVRFGEKSRDVIAGEFSASVVISKTMSVYKNLLRLRD